jgi:pyrimidine operon attenuation protein/uracil phosphoribosyltransferase
MPKLPDATALCAQLAGLMRPAVTSATALVGIRTGGAWVAEWLHRELDIKQPLGSIDISFYRDDFSQRGLHKGAKASQIPFDVEGAHIVIVDDVLYTGRTIRAAINELFDYGRPARVDLAVLVDRGGRDLPVAATWCPGTIALPPGQTLVLERSDDALSFRIA